MNFPKLIPMILLTLNVAVNSGSTVVPNEAENQEGNDWSYRPFVNTNIHYQQVYDASQFSAISPGGAYITFLTFRSDCVLNTGGVLHTSLQVNLSTTLKGPDQLSSVFAENVGTNNTVVFGPGRFWPAEPGGSNNCPLPFESSEVLELDTPFFYNRAQGNLLVEVQVDGGATYFNPGGFANDAVNLPGDSVSRAYALSSDATVATQIDTIGLVTGFEFYPVPSLTNSLATNGVVLTWPAHPPPFVLQTSGVIGSNANWTPYPTNQIGGNFLYRIVTIPYSGLSARQFFRLAWDSGAPIASSKIVDKRGINEPLPVGR